MKRLFNNLYQLSYMDRIKLLMAMVMTMGHLAWAFIPRSSAWSSFLHFFARMAIPLACFLVVEGFYKTHNLKGYIIRLFGFAFVAQFAFIFANVGIDKLIQFLQYLWVYGNVLFGLGFALIALIAINKIKQPNNPTLPYLAQTKIHLERALWIIAIIMLCLLSFWSDWSLAVIIWVLAIYYKRAVGFLVANVALIVSSFFVDNESKWLLLNGRELMDYGGFLAFFVMRWYDNNKHQSPQSYRLPRLFFYYYYIGHLLVIGVLVSVFGHI